MRNVRGALSVFVALFCTRPEVIVWNQRDGKWHRVQRQIKI